MLSRDDSFGKTKETGLVDGSASLAAGLYAYLQEVDGYRIVCRRHGGKAAVDAQEGGVRVTRCFESGSATVAHLQVATQLLPRWKRRISEERGAGKRRDGPRLLVQCDVLWEGRRLLVEAFQPSSTAVLHVELSLWPWESDLPELPLRMVATALRCHEFLLPDGIARPLPVPADGRGGREIRAYLMHAMPKNLYASQCI
jgi:hypothetical protein